MATAAAERGPVRVWVNNAGIARATKGFEGSDEDVRLIVETNLLGVMWGSRVAIEAMGPAGGHVINIGSLSSLGPVPGLSAYAATKNGVLGWTTSIQGDLDLAGIPVRMHVVCPDASDTRMVQDVADNPEAAILFSGPRLLGAARWPRNRCAARRQEGGPRDPRWRGAVARAARPFRASASR